MKKTLIVTVGLPRSGKSTWAKKKGFPIVSRDAIRLALHGHAFIGEAESMVTAIEDYMVEALFLAGHDNVIVDGTHITEDRRARWADKAEARGWWLFYACAQTTPGVCIKRAMEGEREDLIPVISRMAEKLEWPNYCTIQI